MEGFNTQPNKVETEKESAQEMAQKNVAEMFRPLSSEPISEVGTKKVLERLSIEAVSGRNGY